MKSHSKIFMACMLAVCLMFGGLNVALAVDDVSPLRAATSISINQTKYLAKGYAKPLVLTAKPAGATLPDVTWQSSNPDVATVDDSGIVTGKKAGTATITATAKDDASITAQVNLTVYSSYRYKVDWSGAFNQADNNQTTTAALPVDSGRVQKAWEVAVGNSTIAIVDDYVYTYNGTHHSAGDTSRGGVLYKIDKKTGTIMDSLQCAGECGNYYSYIFYGGGLLYVSCVGSVMAFDLDSFTQLWMTETGSNVSYCTAQYVNGCVVTNGVVLDGTTGKLKANLPGGYAYSSGAEENGLFYIAAADGNIYAFDTTTWQTKYSLKYSDGKGGNSPGVALSGNRLYWGEASGGKLYAVQIATDGSFVTDSLKTLNCGVSGPCVPVIAGGRLYLAGTANDQGAVAVVKVADMSLQYVAYGASEKIQSTPIVRVVNADGPVVSAVSDMVASPTALADGNYVFVQDYTSPSRILMLKDDVNTTSGSLSRLVTVAHENYAYEQIACDKDGALYVTNDSGYLMRYVATQSTGTVIYGDVDNDGSVTTKDVAQLKRYLAGWANVTINQTTADVNASGGVDAKDVALLKRYLAGWNVTLGPAA